MAISSQAKSAYCPALFITAPSSGSGKTTVVAAMARYWRNKGLNVRVFKTGPDYIDPMFHEVASGNKAYQLDIGMMGLEACQRHLYQAAKQADLILIEGVMGMYDGKHHSAELARQLNVPLMAVIPASGMAQTFGAIAYGLANYQADTQLFGVVANEVGSLGHAKLLQDSLPKGIAFCGSLPKNAEIALPEQHLGLTQAHELTSLDSMLNTAAKLLSKTCELPLPEPIEFSYQTNPSVAPLLKGVRVGIAKDAAFSFIYHDNVELLTKMGATISDFSPITDSKLPEVDALYLPGGYPESYQSELSNNQPMLSAIRQHITSAKPTLAECGGMLYLLEQFQDAHGNKAQFVGAMQGKGTLHKKLKGIGMVSANIAPTPLTGHTFHYSTLDTNETSIFIASQQGKVRAIEPVYLISKTLASYTHWYWPSNPSFIAAVFKGEIKPSDYSTTLNENT
ncbi:cobyrinate a,c-diamide synthase [Shewanella sp. KT0246]|uniref:cobyrinate a,c-diamide synthase n=1 Tax=Shewanella sp. KT0246 TaxID=2815912 RepID=UPI001C7D975B|nr:cobyrinate a,c-diamide synthase [Shewanella sp. KT0246]